MCVFGSAHVWRQKQSHVSVSPYLLQGLLLTTAYCKQAGPQFLRILLFLTPTLPFNCWDY